LELLVISLAISDIFSLYLTETFAPLPNAEYFNTDKPHSDRAEMKNLGELMSKEMLKNTVLALLDEAPGLGEVQLRKALVIVDVLNMAYYGEGLTGASYIKQPHGPVPDRASWDIINNMRWDDQIYVVEEPVGIFTKHGYYRKDDPDYSCFTQSQIFYIQDAARFAVKNTATNLSNLTHDQVYESTPMGEVIPLSAMFEIRVKPAKRFTDAQKEKVKEAIDADRDFILSFSGTAKKRA
jgi:hypothetical protein